MRAEVVQRVDKVLHVILHEQDDDDTNAGALDVGTSVNARIVEAGLATVERRRERFLQSLVRKKKTRAGGAGRGRGRGGAGWGGVGRGGAGWGRVGGWAGGTS